MLDDARVDRRAVVDDDDDDARRRARAASRDARERRAELARTTREKARVGVGAEDMARGVARCGVGKILLAEHRVARHDDEREREREREHSTMKR